MAISDALERAIAERIAKQHTLKVYVYCLPCGTEQIAEIDIKHWFSFATPVCKKCLRKMLVTTEQVEVQDMQKSQEQTTKQNSKQPASTTPAATSNGKATSTPAATTDKNSTPATNGKQQAQPAAKQTPVNQAQPAKKNLPYTNVITLNGRLYADAEETELNGYACVKFDLAHWQPKNRPTQKYAILVFDETLRPYAATLTKGTQVMISGRLTTDTYNNKPQLSILAHMITEDVLEVSVVEKPVE
jgi:transcription elongation factor Elf1